MGTPHLGSDVAGNVVMDLVKGIMSLFTPTDRDLLKQLEKDSVWLRQQHRDFAAISYEFHTTFFYEGLATLTVGGKSVYVRLFYFTRFDVPGC